MARRKPPKHIPKEFPDDHFLFGQMTPKEWVGMQINTLHIRAKADLLMVPVERPREFFGKNYSDLMETRGARTAAWREEYIQRAMARGHDPLDALGKWERSDAGQEWYDDVYHEMREDQGLSEDEEPTWTNAGRRLHGVWPSIFDAARAKVKEAFGIEVSDRTLKECLAEYRKRKEGSKH